MVDVVSGATLADTDGYVNAFVEAAKAAKQRYLLNSLTERIIMSMQSLYIKKD